MWSPLKLSPIFKCRLFLSCLAVIENFIWIEPLLRGHLSYKATFSLSQSDLLMQAWLYCVLIVQYLGGLGGVRVFNATFNNISLILWWSVLLVEDVQYWSVSLKLIIQKFYDVGPGPYLGFFNNNLPLLLHLGGGGGCLFFIICYLNKNWDWCIAGSLVNPLTSDHKPNTTDMNSCLNTHSGISLISLIYDCQGFVIFVFNHFLIYHFLINKLFSVYEIM